MDIGADPLLGNRYRLGRLVGRGGMSTVHAATDVQLGRQVAVKLFHPGADEIAVARLQAEARLLAGRRAFRTGCRRCWAGHWPP